MSDFLLFVLLGLGTGAFIAGLSLAAVISYRGSGVINLSLGAIAMLGGYVFYGLRTGGYLWLPPIPFVGHRIDLGSPWSTAPAMIVALAVCALTGALLDGLVFRRLRGAAPLAKLIATLGLLLTLQAIVLVRFGSDGQQAPPILPSSSVHLLGVSVQENGLLLAGIVVAITIALIALYRYSRFGLATRAAAEDERMAMRNGLSPDRLSMINTVLACMLAGLVGMLFAPISQLDSSTLALSIIPALAAALLARFTSFGAAAAFGIGVGVIESLLTWLQSKPWFPTAGGIALPGVSDVVFLIVIGLVLFARGHVLPERGAVTEKRLPAAPAASRVRGPALLLIGVAAIAIIVFPYGYRLALINSLIGTVMCLSLVVITGFLGQVSLLQFGLAGITALVLTKLTASSGIGFPLAPIIGVGAAVLVGLVTAVPTLRVRGASLAIITMAGAVAISNFWLGNISFGFNPASGAVGSPTLFGLDLGPDASFPFGSGGSPSPVFGFFCLVATAGCGLLVVALRRGELGRRMLAIRSNERAAAAAGVNVRETKLVAYGIAAFIAGVGGALYAYSFQNASPDNFNITVALSFIAFAYLGGITTVSGAIVGGLLCTEALAVHLANQLFGIPPNYELVFAGLVLILTVVQNPEGITGGLRQLALRLRARRGVRPVASSSTSPAPTVPS